MRRQKWHVGSRDGAAVHARCQNSRSCCLHTHIATAGTHCPIRRAAPLLSLTTHMPACLPRAQPGGRCAAPTGAATGRAWRCRSRAALCGVGLCARASATSRHAPRWTWTPQVRMGGAGGGRRGHRPPPLPPSPSVLRRALLMPLGGGGASCIAPVAPHHAATHHHASQRFGRMITWPHAPAG